jgi:hypothetical protein
MKTKFCVYCRALPPSCDWRKPLCQCDKKLIDDPDCDDCKEFLALDSDQCKGCSHYNPDGITNGRWGKCSEKGTVLYGADCPKYDPKKEQAD